jgi:hypothetical protein
VSAREEDLESATTKRNNQTATGSNASASTHRGMGWSNELQVTQIAMQSQSAEAREKDRKINSLYFQINQAQQSVKTDIDLAKAMAPNDLNDELWKDVLEGRKKVKVLGVQLVQMHQEHEKPSENLQIVDNFLRNAVPPTTPTDSSKMTRSETPGTHASGASNLTDFSTKPPSEVRVPTPIKKPKTSTEFSNAGLDRGFGFCAAGKLCGMPLLALERGCFGPTGQPMHTCTECKGIVQSGLSAVGDGYALICRLCDQ